MMPLQRQGMCAPLSWLPVNLWQLNRSEYRVDVCFVHCSVHPSGGLAGLHMAASVPWEWAGQIKMGVSRHPSLSHLTEMPLGVQDFSEVDQMVEISEPEVLGEISDTPCNHLH